MSATADMILRRFRSDFKYYAPRCLKIRTKKGTVVPFVLNRAQEYIHERLEEQLATTGKVRALVLKGRQQGASTYIGGRYYWKLSGEFGKVAFILTHEQAATDNLFVMTKRYHDNCPDELRPATAADNAKELWFNKLDSRYKVATAGSKAVGRSATAQYFHGSEVGFWPNANDHIAGIGQTVPDEAETEIIFESTGNGIGNMFHTMWQSAEAGEGEYIAIFVPWFWEDGYAKPVPLGFKLDATELKYQQTYGLTLEQMVWRRMKIVELGGDVSLFNQEYPATADMAFMASSENSLIASDLVTRARKHRFRKQDEAGPLVIGVDPAEYGSDKTAIVPRRGRKVFPVTRLSKKGPMEQAGLLAIMIEELQPDALCIDVTGVGTGVADRLIEMGYGDLIYRIHFGGKAIEDEKYVNKRAEVWGNMKDWLEDEPNELPEDDALQSDLTGLTYSYDSSRRLVLESKEHAKKRGLRSPDSADGLALTFAVKVAPRKPQQQSWRERLLGNRNRPPGSAQAA
jgi:hypothetical protein